MINTNEYGAYYEPYVSKVGDTNITDALSSGLKEVATFFYAIPQEKQEYRYEEEKWTPKEILLHLIDCERVFMYRALQIARSENVDLAGFDQDEFVANSAANAISMKNLLQEYKAVREASISFMDNCESSTLTKIGRASDSPLSVRAAAYITRGHELHHVKIIKERYL